MEIRLNDYTLGMYIWVMILFRLRQNSKTQYIG